MKWWQIVLSQFVDKLPRILRVILGRKEPKE